jgi:hypothetical protein
MRDGVGMEFKEAVAEVTRGMKGERVIVPGVYRWKRLHEKAKKTMCRNWNPDGSSGCKLFGPQARCSSCRPRFNVPITSCGVFGCVTSVDTMYCSVCKKYYCNTHEHSHKDENGKMIQMGGTVEESKTAYVPSEKISVVGGGLTLKGV